MNQDQFRTVKKIVVIARRHFRCGKNLMPDLKAQNPHFGKWAPADSIYNLHVKFDSDAAQVYLNLSGWLSRQHLFIHRLDSIMHDLNVLIEKTTDDFALYTLLIGFRGKINHLHADPIPLETWNLEHTLRP